MGSQSDWPTMKPHRLAGDGALMTGLTSRVAPPDHGDVARTRRLGEAIKDVARQGKHKVPGAIVKEVRRSPLSTYVGAKLLWDPFADTSHLIDAFHVISGARDPGEVTTDGTAP